LAAALRWLVVVGALVFAVASLASAWGEVRDDLSRLTPASLAVALVAFLVASVALAASWYAMLDAVGRPQHCGPRPAAEVFAVGQVGKYAPGAVWPVVVQTQIGQRHGLRWRTILMTYTLSVVVVLATGSFVALGSLAGPGPRWLRAAVLGGAVLGAVLTASVLHPDAAHRLLNKLFVRATGEGLPERLQTRAAALSFVAGVVFWALVGIHASAILHPLGVPTSRYVYVAGCFALAWVAGVAAVPVPAGVGVREAVLVLSLGSLVGRPAAVTLALVSRLVQVAVDLGVAGLLASLGVFARARRTAGGATDLAGLEGSDHGQ
jgi:hypothetical protein